MAQYRVRGEGFAETVTADDWRVCDGGNVVFYTGNEKVAYYRSPVSVRGIGTPTGDAHAETKKVAAQRDHFQQRNLDLERVVEGLRNERDDWQTESHRLQEVVDRLCERHTQEDWDAAMTALEGARESRDHWRGMYQNKDRAALGKIRELQQELETAKEQYRQLLSSLSVEELNKALEQVQHWKDKYTELHREVHVALRDKAFWQTRHKEAEDTIKDLRQENNKQVQFWKKRYKQAVATIKDLNQELNSSEKQSASLEDLREAQRERDSWHRKYVLLAAKRND